MVNLPPVRSLSWAATYSMPAVKARLVPHVERFHETFGPSMTACAWAGIAVAAKAPATVAKPSSVLTCILGLLSRYFVLVVGPWRWVARSPIFADRVGTDHKWITLKRAHRG